MGKIAGVVGGRHHAGRPLRISRRAQDQPGNAQLHAGRQWRRDRQFGARQDLHQQEDGRVELQHVTSLGEELPAHRLSARGRGMTRRCSRSPRRAGIRRQPGDAAAANSASAGSSSSSRRCATSPARSMTNKRLLVFGLLAIIAQILIIYFLSRVISRRSNGWREGRQIEDSRTASTAAARIADPRSRGAVEGDRHARHDDKIVCRLRAGRAGQTASQSDQKLELGGHSRFLTIFFSDLEAFSTLSEEVPSQELMPRVSAYSRARHRCGQRRGAARSTSSSATASWRSGARRRCSTTMPGAPASPHCASSGA